MSAPFLLESTPTNNLVNLPSGKLSIHNNQRIDINPQKGANGLLYALRRLAYFLPHAAHDKYFNVFISLRNTLGEFDGENFKPLLVLAKKIENEWQLNFEQTLFTHPIFSTYYATFLKSSYGTLLNQALSKADYFKYCSPRQQWLYLFSEIIKTFIFPLFQLQEASFMPNQGIAGLMSSLQKHGAHVFLGAFGRGYHSGLLPVASESTRDREVLSFRNSFIPMGAGRIMHAIVVDQVKIINEKAMVFFRDPYDSSSENKREKVYLISYKKFIRRLKNLYFEPAIFGDEQEVSCGIVSKFPDKLCQLKNPQEEQKLKPLNMVKVSVR